MTDLPYSETIAVVNGEYWTCTSKIGYVSELELFASFAI